MGAEKDGPCRTGQPDRMSLIDLRELPVAARPCRAGVLNAEPGGGRASGAAQRRRLDQIQLNSAMGSHRIASPRLQSGWVAARPSCATQWLTAGSN
jgi:hypothetical protein